MTSSTETLKNKQKNGLIPSFAYFRFLHKTDYITAIRKCRFFAIRPKFSALRKRLCTISPRRRYRPSGQALGWILQTQLCPFSFRAVCRLQTETPSPFLCLLHSPSTANRGLYYQPMKVSSRRHVSAYAVDRDKMTREYSRYRVRIYSPNGRTPP